VICTALINACWGAKRARIRPTRRDSHGGRSDECLSRACIACQHYAIDSNTYNPLTCEEARGVEAPFKSFRVHLTHKGQETGGNYVSQEETTPVTIREPHPRPLMALSQRFRGCTGTSFFFVCPGSYRAVPGRWRNWQSATCNRPHGATAL